MTRRLTIVVCLCASIGVQAFEYSRVAYEATVPGGDDTVVYALDIFAERSPADTLMPLRYLVEWTRTAPSGDVSEGFTAYFDGNFFRSANGKFTEYHYTEEPLRFAPGGVRESGVQFDNMFVDLIPSVVEERNAGAEIIADRRGDVVVSESRYVYAPDGRPSHSETVIGRDTPGEQVITVDWTYPDYEIPFEELTEDVLTRRHSYEFGELRIRNTDAAAMVGKPLPSLHAPMIGGERFVYTRGEGFRTPVVLAVFDSETDSVAEVLGAIQTVLRDLPERVELIPVFRSNRFSDISAATSPLGLSRVLFSGRTVVKDLGVKEFPTLFFVNSDGTVADVCEVENNGLGSVVISMTAKLY
ncbi:MAG: hypothetical protein K2M19_07540 [Muribaculaceae bacterium]|nr:hypothetical protein [Muribaculaceae bacterium]